MLPAIKKFSSLVTSSFQHYVCRTHLHCPRKSHNYAHSFPPHGFMWLAGVVYSFVWDSSHTEYVAEETSSENKKDVDGKTAKT